MIAAKMNKIRNSRLCFVFILYLGQLNFFYSQKYNDPTTAKKFEVIVNAENSTIKTYVLRQKKKVQTKANRIYYWYGSQKIMETIGGFDGRLLHGEYTAVYLNNQLKEKGSFCYGLKSNRWKYWYYDGKLKEVITWKKGRKNGYYALYNDFGELMAEGNFKNDKLHGSFKTYGNSGKLIEKKKYKNGEELITPLPELPKEEKKKTTTST